MDYYNNPVSFPTKIMDGLYLGDQYAAQVTPPHQDIEFLLLHQVTHIINCSGKQIPNYFESRGVQYLTFQWVESERQFIFDDKDEIITMVQNFINNTLVKSQSVLIHSSKSSSRALLVLISYFMKKYKWTLYKTFEFLSSRKPDFEIKNNFFQQLTALEKKMIKAGQIKYTTWNQFHQDPLNLDSTQLILRNTYINSKKNDMSINQHNLYKKSRVKSKKKIKWKDSVGGMKGLVQEHGYQSEQSIKNPRECLYGVCQKPIIKVQKFELEYKQIECVNQGEKRPKSNHSRNNTSEIIDDKGKVTIDPKRSTSTRNKKGDEDIKKDKTGNMGIKSPESRISNLVDLYIENTINGRKLEKDQPLIRKSMDTQSRTQLKQQLNKQIPPFVQNDQDIFLKTNMRIKNKQVLGFNRRSDHKQKIKNFRKENSSGMNLQTKNPIIIKPNLKFQQFKNLKEEKGEEIYKKILKQKLGENYPLTQLNNFMLQKKKEPVKETKDGKYIKNRPYSNQKKKEISNMVQQDEQRANSLQVKKEQVGNMINSNIYGNIFTYNNLFDGNSATKPKWKF